MLASPILKTMSVEDLNQRYRETYVLYKDTPTYIREFTDGGKKMYINSQAGGDDYVSFEWEYLNVERPRSRWYIPQGLPAPFYIAYPPKKQYHRGLCDGNVLIYPVDRRPLSWFRYGTMLRQGYQAIDTTPIEVGKVGIYKDHFYVHKGPGKKLMVFFRSIMLALLDPESGLVELGQPRFKQEILEMFKDSDALDIRIGAPIVIPPPKPEPDELVPGPDMMVVTRWGEAAKLTAHGKVYIVRKPVQRATDEHLTEEVLTLLHLIERFNRF